MPTKEQLENEKLKKALNAEKAARKEAEAAAQMYGGKEYNPQSQDMQEALNKFALSDIKVLNPKLAATIIQVAKTDQTTDVARKAKAVLRALPMVIAAELSKGVSADDTDIYLRTYILYKTMIDLEMFRKGQNWEKLILPAMKEIREHKDNAWGGNKATYKVKVENAILTKALQEETKTRSADEFYGGSKNDFFEKLVAELSDENKHIMQNFFAPGATPALDDVKTVGQVKSKYNKIKGETKNKISEIQSKPKEVSEEKVVDQLETVQTEINAKVRELQEDVDAAEKEATNKINKLLKLKDRTLAGVLADVATDSYEETWMRVQNFVNEVIKQTKIKPGMLMGLVESFKFKKKFRDAKEKAKGFVKNTIAKMKKRWSEFSTKKKALVVVTSIIFACVVIGLTYYMIYKNKMKAVVGDKAVEKMGESLMEAKDVHVGWTITVVLGFVLLLATVIKLAIDAFKDKRYVEGIAESGFAILLVMFIFR